jgi:hypothetical protein
MTTAWSHLPNAVHIDRIIAAVRSHPDVWVTAAAEISFAPAWTAAREASYAARREEAWCSAFSATATSTRGWTRINRVAPGGAILALIAWDHSAKFLDMTVNELKMWTILSEDPAAILLLPAVVAFAKIAELEMA